MCRFPAVLLPLLLLAPGLPACHPRTTTLAVGDARHVLVRVDAGSFRAGPPADDPQQAGQEGPRVVEIPRSFWIGRTELTQDVWQEVAPLPPGHNRGDRYPVDFATWSEILSFCNELSRRMGLEPAYDLQADPITWNPEASGYRLPTEEEWEYAARAGEDHLYAGSDDLDEVAWYKGNSGMVSHPVAEKKPNAWGLHDMSGNLEECVWNERFRIGRNRGGSLGNEPPHLRVFNEHAVDPDRRYHVLGFRLARNVAPGE